MDDDVLPLLETRRYRQAFERLLDLYATKVFRMAVMFLKDPAKAEDVTQDVFLKLWRALPAYDGRASPATWLYTIARNTCLTELRSKAYRNTVPFAPAMESAAGNGCGSGDALKKVALMRCLSRLPEIQRNVITMFYLQERSIDEVGRALDLPAGTVKSHLHRARLALAGMMKE